MKNLKSAAVLCLILAFGIGAFSKGPVRITGDQALAKLAAGNKRFVKTGLLHPNQTAARRKAIAKGQTPFAIVLSCSDSRVPPEIAFDQGLGDLFVYRVAGNTVNNECLGSIEYAIDHFNVPLLMVLGHQRCGAVEAAVKGGEAPGHIGSVLEPLKPAVEKTRGMPGDHVENAVRANVELMVDQLKNSSPIIAEAVRNGKLKIVGARYDLRSGKVEIIK